METILQDLRYGLRSLWKTPGFAIVATLTLALAIGVNTAVFSLVNVIVFADLPMQDSETVLLIRGVNVALEVDQGSVSVPDYLDLVERTTSFSAMSALTDDQWVLTGADRPLRVQGARISANLTETWRLPAVLGRPFAEGEDLPGAPPVAMLSHGFWESQYDGRPGVLTEVMRLDGEEYTIVGVMNPKFEFAEFAEVKVFVPLQLDRAGSNRAARGLFVTTRLAPGVSQERATEEVARIGRELEAEYPESNRGWGLSSGAVMDSLIDDEGNLILLLLQMMVASIILIACANVANMLLARATARSREMAVRAALGAGRGRLIRQLLTESVVISLAAGLLGLGFAKGLNEALIRISNGTEVVFMMATLDGRVLAFTLLIALVAPLFFGLFPALRASGMGAADALRDGRSAAGGRSGKGARNGLVVAQVSLALTLMVVSGLLVRTVVHLQTRPLGFDVEGLLTVELDLPETGYASGESRRQFFAQAREAMSGVPGVSEVELVNAIPAAGQGSRRMLSFEGRDLPEGQAPPAVLAVTVSPGYFDLTGIPLLAGRAFEAQDGPESVPVALLSREVADTYWPSEDPLGQRIQFVGVDSGWIRIVGIVGDVRSLTDSEGGAVNVYMTHDQDSRSRMYLVTRTSADPAALAGPIRASVWSVDPGLPIDGIQTMRQAQYDSAGSNYALLTLFVTFAVFAMAMAALGIYGVMSYSVSQRRSEMGLRMALGAEISWIRWMVVSQGVRLVAVGIVVGLVASFAVSRMLSSLVFGISTTDPLIFLGVPAILGTVAMIANYIPAVRATRTDPADALRIE